MGNGSRQQLTVPLLEAVTRGAVVQQVRPWHAGLQVLLQAVREELDGICL